MKSFPNGGAFDGPIIMDERDNGTLSGVLYFIKSYSLSDLSKEILALEKEMDDLGFDITSTNLDQRGGFFTIIGRKHPHVR